MGQHTAIGRSQKKVFKMFICHEKHVGTGQRAWAPVYEDFGYGPEFADYEKVELTRKISHSGRRQTCKKCLQGPRWKRQGFKDTLTDGGVMMVLVIFIILCFSGAYWLGKDFPRMAPQQEAHEVLPQ
jgi:hypothetical protein